MLVERMLAVPRKYRLRKQKYELLQTHVRLLGDWEATTSFPRFGPARFRRQPEEAAAKDSGEVGELPGKVALCEFILVA